MRERRQEFERRGVRVFGVTFESAQRIQEYSARGRLPYPMLRDPGRRGYKRFGIERQSARRIFSPGTGWYYIKRFLQGRMPALDGSDYFQLGGNVLLDARGSPVWVYRSQNPADRPSVDDILREIDRHSAGLGV